MSSETVKLSPCRVCGFPAKLAAVTYGWWSPGIGHVNEGVGFAVYCTRADKGHACSATASALDSDLVIKVWNEENVKSEPRLKLVRD